MSHLDVEPASAGSTHQTGADLSDSELLAIFPGSMIDDRFIDHDTITEWAAGLFHDGPLDGQRRQVPAFGPPWVRHHHSTGVAWYAIKEGTKRTYDYVGDTPPEGPRAEPAQMTFEAA